MYVYFLVSKKAYSFDWRENAASHEAIWESTLANWKQNKQTKNN
jgi:hypothetical protein